MNREFFRFPLCCGASRFVLMTLSLALGGAASLIAASQPSPADGPWSGSVQCVLDVQLTTYTRQETQTWTLTGDAPTSDGDFRIYNATWTVTGQGSLKKAQGQHLITTTWTVNVPATPVKLAVFVRASDQKLIVRQWSSPAQVPGAVVGTKRVTVNGQTGPATQVTAPASEWSFQWIDEDKDQTTLDGSKTTNAEALPADFFFSGAPTNATCTWQFTKGGGSPPQRPPREPVPQLRSIDPAAVDQGANDVLITLAAQGTHWQSGVTTADFGPDIRVAALTVSSPTNAVARIIVSSSAPIGPRVVMVTTPTSTNRPETVGLLDKFTVNAVLAPIITAVSPNGAAPGASSQAVYITARDTNFVQGSSHADFGPGITVASLFITSPTSATVVLGVARDAAAGWRAVTVTTGAETATLANGFEVRLPPPPPISSAATTGKYRIILNGFRVNRRTFEGVENDGPGDEIYAAVRVQERGRDYYTFRKDRLWEIKTAVHGCVEHWPDRIRGGSAHPLGGFVPGDLFPREDPATSRANPVSGSFPLLLWEGELTDGGTIVVLKPTLWEADGDDCIFRTKWEGREQNDDHLFWDIARPEEELRDRAAKTDLAPVDRVGPRIPCTNAYAPLDAFYGSDAPCWCKPGIDRPIGLVAHVVGVPNNISDVPLPGTDYATFTGMGIVVTREAIEKSLSMPATTGGIAPGIVAIRLMDSGSRFDGDYHVYLRFDRISSPPPPGASPTAGVTPVRPPERTAAPEPPTADVTPTRPPERTAAPEPVTPGRGIRERPGGLTALQPVITEVTPNSAPQWTENLTITVTARLSNFAPGATTIDLGPGITRVGDYYSVESATRVLGSFKIAGDAPPGPRTVTITTGNEVLTLPNGFTVRPRAARDVFRLTPETGQQGQQNLTVNISTFQWRYFVLGTTADFGPGITVKSVEVQSEFAARATLNIEPTAAVGPRNVNIRKPGGGVDVFTDVFAVAAAALRSDFQQGSRPSGIGDRTMRTPDGDLTPVPVASPPAERTAAPEPTSTRIREKPGFNRPPSMQGSAITQVSPNTGVAGAKGLLVTLTGNLTHFAQGTTIVNFGPGITVSSLIVASPTSATATLNIDRSAVAGPRTITLTTGAEVVTLVDGFSVVPRTSASDTEPPTAATNLSATDITTSSLRLSWSRPYDSTDVTGYDVILTDPYTGQVEVRQNAVSSAVLWNLSFSRKAYRIQVRARDLAGNTSLSAALVVTLVP